tara:strand:- start:13751 stop:14974 length:1224 start_codon:yes stop_codon:yes gene_type:complete
MESRNHERAVQLFELGKYKDAIEYFQKAIPEDPNNWTSKFYLAISYINLDNYDEAGFITDSLLEEQPNNPDVFYIKAKILLHKDNFKEANKFIDIAISINPYNADYFGLKAGLLLHEKKFEDGLAKANEGLKIDPKNAYCLNLRAQLLTKLNRIPEADQTVENILFDNPEDSFSHANVGWVELENGNTKKALNHFKQALQFNPNFDYAREGMSTALKSKNFIYSWYLKYSFWMAKKSSKNQWIFVIGIYVAYRIGAKVLDVAGMTYLIIPLIITYLLFALGGWIMEPLSNTILNFDSYGKYLLDKKQKASGYTFGILALLGISNIALFYILGIDYCLTLAIAFICALIPFPRAFLMPKKNSKIFGIVYGVAMILVAFLAPFFTTLMTTQIIIFIMLIAFTWLGNFGN